MRRMDQNLDAVGRIQAAWRRERPDTDVAPQGIIGRLHRLSDFIATELGTVFEAHGISQGEFDVLASLRRAGAPYERTPSELAEHTMVTTGATTKRIDRLAEAGLIERRAAEGDGRRKIIALTTAGLRVVDETFTDHMANEHRIVAELSAEDRAQLEAILVRWLGKYES